MEHRRSDRCTPKRVALISWVIMAVALTFPVAARSSAATRSERLRVHRHRQRVSLPPRVLSERNADQYLWVETAELFDPTGRMILADRTVLPETWRTGRLAENIRDDYESQRSGETAPECMEFWSIVEPVPGSLPSGGFDEIVLQAQAVVRGRVLGVSGGFLNGRPGLMLEIRAMARRPADGRFATTDVLFVFYPAGEVPFGVTAVCPRYDGITWPAAPDIGDEVLLLPGARNSPVHSTLPIVELDPWGFEFLSQAPDHVRAASTLAGRQGVAGVRSIDELWIRVARVFSGVR